LLACKIPTDGEPSSKSSVPLKSSRRLFRFASSLGHAESIQQIVALARAKV
jgi:hypothetical protein